MLMRKYSIHPGAAQQAAALVNGVPVGDGSIIVRLVCHFFIVVKQYPPGTVAELVDLKRQGSLLC